MAGGWGVIGGPPIQKMGLNFFIFHFLLCARGRGAATGGIGGGGGVGLK